MIIDTNPPETISYVISNTAIDHTYNDGTLNTISNEMFEIYFRTIHGYPPTTVDWYNLPSHERIAWEKLGHYVIEKVNDIIDGDSCYGEKESTDKTIGG